MIPPQRAATVALLALTLLTACTSARDGVPAPPSPGPLGSPRPTLAPRQAVYVGNTDRFGTTLRQTPGLTGAQIRVVPDGAVFEATGREQQADGRTWAEVRDSTGAVGWVIADYLSTAPPPRATPTLMPGMTTPTATPGLVPFIASETPTTPTAVVRPIDTLVPIMQPGQQPGLAPLPPSATPRPGLPTLPPIAPPRPTNEMIDVEFGTPNTRPGIVAPTRAPTRTLGPAGR